MIKISTKSQYGLRAMAFLANSPGSVISLREVSEKEEIPFDYLEKIIGKLEKENLLKSKKGARGGYFLAKKPSKIKVGQIVSALEGKTNLVGCLDGRHKCARARKCATKRIWQKIQNSLNKTLNSLTLADLLK